MVSFLKGSKFIGIPRAGSPERHKMHLCFRFDCGMHYHDLILERGTNPLTKRKKLDIPRETKRLRIDANIIRNTMTNSIRINDRGWFLGFIRDRSIWVFS